MNSSPSLVPGRLWVASINLTENLEFVRFFCVSPSSVTHRHLVPREGEARLEGPPAFIPNIPEPLGVLAGAWEFLVE